MNKDDQKLYYKLYKAKKQWLVAGLTTVGVGFVMGGIVHADTTSNANVLANSSNVDSASSQSVDSSSEASSAEVTQALSAMPVNDSSQSDATQVKSDTTRVSNLLSATSTHASRKTIQASSYTSAAVKKAVNKVKNFQVQTKKSTYMYEKINFKGHKKTIRAHRKLTVKQLTTYQKQLRLQLHNGWYVSANKQVTQLVKPTKVTNFKSVNLPTSKSTINSSSSASVSASNATSSSVSLATSSNSSSLVNSSVVSATSSVTYESFNTNISSNTSSVSATSVTIAQPQLNLVSSANTSMTNSIGPTSSFNSQSSATILSNGSIADSLSASSNMTSAVIASTVSSLKDSFASQLVSLNAQNSANLNSNVASATTSLKNMFAISSTQTSADNNSVVNSLQTSFNQQLESVNQSFANTKDNLTTQYQSQMSAYQMSVDASVAMIKTSLAADNASQAASQQSSVQSQQASLAAMLLSNASNQYLAYSNQAQYSYQAQIDSLVEQQSQVVTSLNTLASNELQSASMAQVSMSDSLSNSYASQMSSVNGSQQAVLNSTVASLTTSMQNDSLATVSSLTNSFNGYVNSVVASMKGVQNALQSSYAVLAQNNSAANSAVISAMQSSYATQSISVAQSNQATLIGAQSQYLGQSNAAQSSYQAMVSNLQSSYLSDVGQLQLAQSSALVSLANNATNQSVNASQTYQTSLAAMQSLMNSQTTALSVVQQQALNSAQTSYMAALSANQQSYNNNLATLSGSYNSQIASMTSAQSNAQTSAVNSVTTSLTTLLATQLSSVNAATSSVAQLAVASVSASLYSSAVVVQQSLISNYSSQMTDLKSTVASSVAAVYQSQIDALSSANQFEHTMAVTSASVDQAHYSPNSNVAITYNLSNGGSNVAQDTVQVVIYKDDNAVQVYSSNKLLAPNDSQSYTVNWQAPNSDYTGYRAEISVNGQVQQVVAIDVSSDVNKFPRYGAITEFTPGTDNTSALDTMKNYYINNLEYYDAYQNPQNPINTDDPLGTWTQTWAPWLSSTDKTKSGQVIKDTVAYAHRLGIDSMFYNMIYAITGNATDTNYLASIGVKPEWLLYRASNNQLFQFAMAGYLSDHNSSDYLNAVQTYLDIKNPEVVDWIVNRMGDVLSTYNFDGWHGDTIGDGDLMYSKDANGHVINEYHVTDELGNFANEVKAKLKDKKFVLNTVSGTGELGTSNGNPSVSQSKVDFDYSEQWVGGYNDITTLIKQVASTTGKSLVVPAYINQTYASTNNGGNFNEPAALLMDAVTYAAGGSRMEIVDGNHLIDGAFFPNKNLSVSADLQAKLQKYQTFITAYENLLRDGQSDNGHGINVYDNSNNNVRSDNATPNTVYAYSRSSNNSETVQLINLLGVSSNDWKDDNGTKQVPTTLNNFHVHYYPSVQYQPGNSTPAKHVYLASPDGSQANQSVEVPFTWQKDQYGYYMDITVPSLQYWDMLYLKSDDSNVSAKVPTAVQFNNVSGVNSQQTNSTNFKQTLSQQAQSDLASIPSNNDTSNFDNKWAYSGSDLGNQYQSQQTTFKVWAPTASNINLQLYANTDSNASVVKSIEMNRGTNADSSNHLDNTIGLYTVTVPGNLNQMAYSYQVTQVNGQVVTSADPYATAATKDGNRSVVVDLNATNPVGFTRTYNQRVSNPTDAIVGETHVRDFSINSNSGVNANVAGKYLGMIQSNTTNNGQATGYDYLKQSQINYVQLQPIQDSNWLDTGDNRYGWGYDPKNYNVVENAYATNPNDPTSGINEFKQLVQGMHNINKGVIMDVVYNHIYNASDSSFEKLVPGYYFRKNPDGTLSSGSYLGNDFATNHEMGRNFVLNSIQYWVNEYGVDGFRFDLMGDMDVQTVQAIQNFAQANHLLVYGEGWWMNTALSDTQKADLWNANQVSQVGFFNGDTRDAIVNNGSGNLGFVNGVSDNNNESKIAGGILGGQNLNNTFVNAGQNVQYVESHDDKTLSDKLWATNASDDQITHDKRVNLANALTVLSQGITFTQIGQGFQRDKNGALNLDTGNVEDNENAINWNDLIQHSNTESQLQQLMAIKKQYQKAFNYLNYADINQHVTIDNATNHSGLVSYTIKSDVGKFIIVFNSSGKNVTLGNQSHEALNNNYADVNFDYGTRLVDGDNITSQNGQFVLPDLDYVVYRFDN